MKKILLLALLLGLGALMNAEALTFPGTYRFVAPTSKDVAYTTMVLLDNGACTLTREVIEGSRVNLYSINLRWHVEKNIFFLDGTGFIMEWVGFHTLKLSPAFESDSVIYAQKDIK